jgi:hypothetical protein
MEILSRNISIIEKIEKYCENIEEISLRFGRAYEAFTNDFAYQYACSM